MGTGDFADFLTVNRVRGILNGSLEESLLSSEELLEVETFLLQKERELLVMRRRTARWARWRLAEELGARVRGMRFLVETEASDAIEIEGGER